MEDLFVSLISHDLLIDDDDLLYEFNVTFN